MKIGIISNGNETLALFKVLTKYSHEYLIYHDQTHFPFGTKNLDFTIIEEIKRGIAFLVSQGAEKVIVDPVYELALCGEGNEVVLPLFRTYLQEYAFRYSLVGKI